MIEPKVGDRVAFLMCGGSRVEHGKVLWIGADGRGVELEVMKGRDYVFVGVDKLIYDNMSDADAPADFAAVGAEVAKEREAGNG